MPSPDFRVVVVDDEGPARAALRHRLTAVGGVRVVGEASSGNEALDVIADEDPDVVFLDIEMADGDGFSVVDGLPEEAPPAVVFVTAYDQYAVEAFEAHALDYVLKPVSRERLEQVLERLRRRLTVERDAAEHRRLLARIGALREEMAAEPSGGGRVSGGGDRAAEKGRGDRLVVKRRGAFSLVPVEEIHWLEAAGNYVRIHVGDESFLHRTTLAELEERLPGARFARVHRSAIVNLDRIERVVPNDSGDFEVHLVTGDVVKLSRSYRDRVLRS